MTEPLDTMLVFVPMSPLTTSSVVPEPLMSMLSSFWLGCPDFGGRNVITAYFAWYAIPATDVWRMSHSSWPKRPAKKVPTSCLVSEISSERSSSQVTQFEVGVLMLTTKSVPGIGQSVKSAANPQLGKGSPGAS